MNIDIERFREIYEATGLSPEGFSRLINVTHRSVYNWLKGEVTAISPLAQIQIAKLEKRLIKQGKLMAK